MNRIDEIKARCEAATSGEWYWEKELLLTHDGVCLVMKPFYDDDTGEVTTCIFQNDKDFIAHSREDIPYLIAEVDKLQYDVSQYKQSARLANELTVKNNILKQEILFLDGKIKALQGLGGEKDERMV